MGILSFLGITSDMDRGPLIEPRHLAEIKEAQKSGTDSVVYHGACLDCIYREGNAYGVERIHWCQGCTYTHKRSDRYPDRRK